MRERLRLVQRKDLLLDMARGKRVLHLGCTDAPYTREAIANQTFLHGELVKVSAEVYGLDADQHGIDLLEKAGYKNIIRCDLEDLRKIDLDFEPEVIVAGEMIEHLNNPGLFLSGLRRFMSPETLLVITTINAYCGMRFFRYGIRGQGGVAEPVHPDHVAYYSFSTLTVLLERHGLSIDEFLFYDIGREHRPFLRRSLNLINDMCVRIAPQWSDGVIAICRRSID